MARMKPAAPIALWRIGIVALASWACGYHRGRGKLEPIYITWTEGRDAKPLWAKYSSCADLAHGIATRCGVREAWVNRTDDDAFGPWVPGANVSKLNGVCATVSPATLPEPGDILILWNRPDTHDAHVCVYIGPNPEKPGEHWTANYGAGGMQAIEFPGAKISSKPLRAEGGGLVYGSKRVQRILTVPELVARASVPPDFSGPEFDADFTGEVQDALEQSFRPSDTDASELNPSSERQG